MHCLAFPSVLRKVAGGGTGTSSDTGAIPRSRPAVPLLGRAEGSFQACGSLCACASVCSNKSLPRPFAFLIPHGSPVAKSHGSVTGERLWLFLADFFIYLFFSPLWVS